jgi:hypothetical protein
MNATSKTLLALTLALTWLPACDKGEDKSGDKSGDKAADAKPEDKTEAKADPHAGMDHHGEADAEPPVEVAADGKIDIEVDAAGYHPATISAPAKATITLAFKRTTESGCGNELVIAALDIKKDLPVGEVVEIPVEVPESGELKFACGMDMYRGKVIPKV